MTQLERAGDQYIVPEKWNDPDWVTDFDNFPDPTFDHLKGEFDWGEKYSSLVYGYIKHLAGGAYAVNLFNGSSKRHKHQRKGRVYSYFLFAKGAATLLNKPHLMRRPYEKALCGSDVINYINKVPLPKLFSEDCLDTPLFRALYSRKHILPMTYSALFSRTFNELSGVLVEHELKIKPREPKLLKCPNCEAIVQLNGSLVYTVENKIAYNIAQEKLEKQKEEQKEYENR